MNVNALVDTMATTAEMVSTFFAARKDIFAPMSVQVPLFETDTVATGIKCLTWMGVGLMESLDRVKWPNISRAESKTSFPSLKMSV